MHYGFSSAKAQLNILYVLLRRVHLILPFLMTIADVLNESLNANVPGDVLIT